MYRGEDKMKIQYIIMETEQLLSMRIITIDDTLKSDEEIEIFINDLYSCYPDSKIIIRTFN